LITTKIKEDLIKHEGYKDEIYLCTADEPTFGIGHMIREEDPEYGSPIGTKVSKERIDECFEQDCAIAWSDAEDIFGPLDQYPESVIRVVVNMAFNLGKPRLSQFKNMAQAVKNKDYVKAADEMVDSRWYNQVGNRSIELENWMRNS